MEGDADMPWPISFLGFPLPAFLLRCPLSLPPSFREARCCTCASWSQSATRYSLLLCLFTLLIGAAESAYAGTTPEHTGFQATLWWQALVPFTQLHILMALSRTGTDSGWAKRALMTPGAQWLGGISLSLYLSHMSVIRYVALLAHPRAVTTLWQCLLDGEEAGEQSSLTCARAREEGQLFPIWATVIVVPVSLCLAEGLHRWVEVPARRALRAR